MNGRTYSSFYVISFAVLSISASDVFIINVKDSERSPLSVSVEGSLRTLLGLLGKRADEARTLRVQVISSSSQKSSKDEKDRLLLRPASPQDLTRINVADLLRIVNANKNVKKPSKKTPLDVQYRLYRDMYGVPNKQNVYEIKTAKRPVELYSAERLPFLQFLISKQISKQVPNMKQTFQDLTRFDSSNISEDYLDVEEQRRDKSKDRYSRDYIDFDKLKFRRNHNYPVKAALRTYSAESNDDSSEATKSKRFEIIKNKNNKKDIKSFESEEVKYKKKKKATFKKKSHKKVKVISMEDAGTSLSSEKVVSHERVRQKSKKKRYQPAKKKHEQSQENDEWNDDNEVGLYLQGNKLTMYPPVEPDSSDENNSDGTRRRGDRLPYFLPKRYYWNMNDIHSLGYFFFNGPKGVSLER